MIGDRLSSDSPRGCSARRRFVSPSGSRGLSRQGIPGEPDLTWNDLAEVAPAE
jgi:hypothetical protein